MHYLYTNGVIAVKEKDLLNEKLLRLCEMNGAEAFRALSESGFGSGAEGNDVESLVLQEEALLDAFIREYAPSEAILNYLLSARDFHNAKAIFKANYLNTSAEKLLAPAGTIPVEDLAARLKNNELETLPEELKNAVLAAEELAELSEEGVSSAEIGSIFEKALFRHLYKRCKGDLLLKKLVGKKADMTNILTALRSQNAESAQKAFVEGGKLPFETLLKLCENGEEALEQFKLTPYADFVAECLQAKEAGRPFTQAERELNSFEAEYFYQKRYELERNQPFLYYVFRRRAEIANVRIIFVCLAAGMKEGQIKARLRAI